MSFYHDYENHRGLPPLDLVSEKAARAVLHPMTSTAYAGRSPGCGCKPACGCAGRRPAYAGSRADQRLVNRPDARRNHASRMSSGRRLRPQNRLGVRVNRIDMALYGSVDPYLTSEALGVPSTVTRMDLFEDDIFGFLDPTLTSEALGVTSTITRHELFEDDDFDFLDDEDEEFGAGLWGSEPIGGWNPLADKVVEDMFPSR